MEKEMLLNKKEQLISNKQKLEENNCKIQFLEKENEDLGIEYIEITESLDRLDKIVYKYEILEQTQKIKKIIKILVIIFAPVIGFVGYIGIVPNVFGAILLTLASYVVINFAGSVPYFMIKEDIDSVTTLTLEEILKVTEEERNKKKTNRKKLSKNIEDLKILNTNNDIINKTLYEVGISLLNDKEAREEIMTEIMEIEPSKELIESITDSMLERNKVKLKSKNNEKIK